MIDQVWHLFLFGFLISFVWMTFLWRVSISIRNAAIVDVGWGLSLLFYCLAYFLKTDGLQKKEVLALAIVAFWALRLSSHLLFDRLIGQKEEGRYQKLREYFKTFVDIKFFFFFQAQALFNGILSLPFLWIALSPNNNQTTVFDIFAVVISLLSIIGEATADSQLKKFKANPANKGKVCDVGLWAYSRHPNYFFEFMIWVGFFLLGVTEPYGYIGIVAPASILYTLLKVTGIPATEAQSLRSRGDAYRNYQKRVSMFVPWFPKKV